MSYASIIGLAWLAYSAYHYMAPGLSGEFKIPYSDITQIDINDSVVKVTFFDSKREECTQELPGLNNKGRDLFQSISLLVQND
jgi:hypothetical protein